MAFNATCAATFNVHPMRWWAGLCLFCAWAIGGGWEAAVADGAEAIQRELRGDETIQIQQLAPDPKGGRAYRLVYIVQVPIEVYWRFKTDFDNDFLLENRNIRQHHIVSRSQDGVVTETKYAEGPDVSFRWETKVDQQERRLTFTLLNPEQCGQRFHYGRITLQPVPLGTQVTQEAYFDFWGVFFWTNYPWRGGMREFLTYTARWEQDTVLRRKHLYLGGDR